MTAPRPARADPPGAPADQGIAAASGGPRVAWIDRARGVALVAMIVFHFCYDLSMFGVAAFRFGPDTGWFWFAAAIVTGFLGLAGVSLQITHARCVRWRGFLRREAILAAAAAVVTLATLVAMPTPIWFGILHAIALFSLLALPFVFAPAWVVVLAAGATFLAPWALTSEAFSHPALYPLGLAPSAPPSLDYEPIFPWFALMLLGLLAARVLPLPRRAPARDPLARMGRHSLAIYLLHQPLMIGGFLGARALGLL